MKLEGLVSVKGAAALLGVHPNTIWNLLHAGSLPSVRVGRRRMIERQALDDYIESHRERKEADAATI